MPITSIRKMSYKILTIAIGTVLALLIGELAATVFGFARFGTLSTDRLYDHARNNTFIRDIEKAKNSYIDTLYPHPYLGFVHRKGYGLDVNNVGLLGHDYSFEKDPQKFVILVTGGSVAAQFAQMQISGIRYLEDILNATYDFGGRDVRILNGGDGAWKQPQQAILFLLYADIVDAVITIDGFNEHYMFRNTGQRLELPASNFHHTNPLARHGFQTLAAVWMSSTVSDTFKNHWLLGRSHLAWLLSYGVKGTLRRLTDHASTNSGGTTIESIFSLPPDWEEDKSFTYNLRQYQKYIRMMQSIADTMNVRTAFFIQPVPAIGKTLSEDEKNVVGDLSYRDTYLRMAQGLLRLRAEDIPVYDLLHIFSEHDETIYADPIHSVRQGERNESEGYRIMAEAISEALEKEWNLMRKEKIE